MTDIDFFRDMLDRAGIGWETSNDLDDRDRAVRDHATDHPDADPIALVVYVQDLGYMGFFAEFYFAGDGHLVAMGAWE